MANTTNFGWETPDDTDLVKDGALAMRTLGNAIDTSLVDLKGGTTGQVLSKNTNTDMDFTWVTPNDADAIQNSIVDAKGDLISATADNTPARLASSGVNGQVLTIDTSTSTGLKWAAAAGGGLTLLSTTTLSGSSTQISIAANSYALILVSVDDWYLSTAAQLKARLNANTGSVYGQNFLDAPNGATYYQQGQTSISIYTGTGGTDADLDNAATIIINNPNAPTNKLGSWIGTAGTGQYMVNGGFIYDDSAVISSVTLFPASGTFSGGTVKIYGA